MLQKVLRVSVVLVIGIVAGLMGWIIGALIGGNYAEQLVFNGVRGYEATGQIGFMLGAVAGLFTGWRVLIKREA